MTVTKTSQSRLLTDTWFASAVRHLEDTTGINLHQGPATMVLREPLHDVYRDVYIALSKRAYKKWSAREGALALESEEAADVIKRYMRNLKGVDPAIKNAVKDAFNETKAGFIMVGNGAPDWAKATLAPQA